MHKLLQLLLLQPIALFLLLSQLSQQRIRIHVFLLDVSLVKNQRKIATSREHPYWHLQVAGLVLCLRRFLMPVATPSLTVQIH